MSLTRRDKRIALVILALAVIGAYWFLLLSPKREEATRAADELAEQEQRRDEALARVAELETAKLTFADDYATLVRLGKAIPSSLDASSLIVQVQRAAHGTKIGFDEIAASDTADGSTPAPAAAPAAGATPPAGSTPPGGGGSAPAAAGGAPAQSAPGQASESAGNAVNNSNAQSGAAAAESGVPAGDTQTSEPARDGALPIGGGAASPGGDATGAAPSPTAAGLESMPFQFKFSGSFFDLADFFHELKRYVRAENERLAVQGRLMTIDGLRLFGGEEGSKGLVAEVDATAYLTPKTEGPTAGATPQGPTNVVPATDTAGPAPASGSPPTAAVAP